MSATRNSDSNDQAAVSFYDATYSRFDSDVYREIRRGVWGEDFDQNSWTTAARCHAANRNMASSTTVVVHDAGRALEYADASFDALVCIDAINHLPDRPLVLADWWRVFRPVAGCSSPIRSSSRAY